MSPSAGFSAWWARRAFTPAVRIEIFDELASLLGNGVPILQALEALHRQASKKGKRPGEPLAIVLASWIRSVKNGRSLGAAVRGWVSPQEQMLITAGETSGTLEASLPLVIEVLVAGASVRGALFGGLAYPISLLASALALLWLFAVGVIPEFARISRPEGWDGLGYSLYVMSNVVRAWAAPGAVLAVAAAIALIVSLPRQTGPIRVRLDRIPPWSMYRLIQGSGFLMSLAALVRAGVPVERALSMIGGGATKWLKERIDGALYGLRQGSNLGEALQRAGHEFPDRRIIDSLVIYSSLSEFDRALHKVAHRWLDKGTQAVRTQSRVLHGLAIITMAGIVIWISLGMFSIQQQLSSSIQSMQRQPAR